MKQFKNWIVVLGISGALLAGCKTAKRPPVKPEASRVVPASTSEPSSSDEDKDLADLLDEGGIYSNGNPESLARFAAGISHALNDEKDAAFDQFYQSALSDPANELLVIEVARGLIAKNESQKAVELLTKSSRRNEASASIWSWLAQAQAKAGQTNQALSSAALSIKKQPASLEGYHTLFSIYLQQKNFSQALSTLNRASKSVTPTPGAFLTLAELYAQYLKLRPQEEKNIRPYAVALVDRVVAGVEKSERLCWAASQAYSHLDEPAKAAAVLSKAQGGEPSPAYRERMAQLYLESGEKKRAAEQLQALVRDYPTRYPQAWFMLGTLASDLHEFSGAVGFFEKAILLDPDMEAAYYNLALAQIDLKKNTDALETLGKARQKFPNTFVGEYFTGVAYTRLKDWKEAVHHMTAAEVIAKASGKALDYQFYFHFGAAAERNHQFEEAAEYFEKCLKLKPDMPEAMNYLGYMLAERGQNLARARELIEKAVKAQPTNAAYLDSMGWVLFMQGKAKEAIPWLIKARDLTEEPDPTLFEHLGDAYIAVGDRKQAQEAFEKSLKIEANEAIKKKLEALVNASP